MAIACAGVVTLAQADPNIEAGKTLAIDKCDECHAGGQDKEGDNLAGVPADKIVKAMQEYKAKTRKHGGMRKRASVLSDQDIEDLAAYYSSKPKK